MPGIKGSVLKRVFLLNVGALFIISALYAVIIGWDVYKVRCLIHSTYRRVASRFVEVALDMSKRGIDNLLNSFAMWEEFYRRVRAKDVRWLGEMLGEDAQAKDTAHSLGVYLEDGSFLYGWGGRLEKQQALKVVSFLKSRFRLGEEVRDIPFFFVKLDGHVHMVGVCPLCDDSGKVLSYSFLLVGRRVEDLASVFPFNEIGGSLEVVDGEGSLGQRVAFVYPLKGFDNSTVGEIVVRFPGKVMEALRMVASATFAFVLILTVVSFGLACYHRRLYRQMRASVDTMLESLSCLSCYQVDRGRLLELSKRDDEIGYVARGLVSILDALADRVIYDPLTRVLNRGAFMTRLEEELERARRYVQSLSFCIIDIDDFKEVNDTYGHPVGDGVLRQFAWLIKSNVRRFDVVGRLGGEEFGIIFPMTDIEGARAACEKLRLKLEETSFVVEDVSLRITASFGVVSFEEADTLQSLYERADGALYMAKTSGKNKVVAIA